MLRVRSNQLLFKEYILVNYNKKNLYKKNYKKIYKPSIKKIFFWEHGINMPNTQQNNEIEQDLLMKNEKSLNQFQNGLMWIKRIWAKKGQKTNLSQTKKIQNIVKNIFQNKIKQIKKNANLLQNTLANVKKRKRLFEKGLKKIAKMQNFPQNEFNQITENRKENRKNKKN